LQGQGRTRQCVALTHDWLNPADMSMEMTTSPPKPPIRQRLSAKLQQALDAMVWEGLSFAEAARSANMNAASMRKALERNHVQAYLRQQRQVFRASLVDEATFRMRALSRQDENKAAAFSATSKLMSESDQEHSSSNQRHAPGLVVQIINSHALPSNTVIEHKQAQVIDITGDKDK
jgi:hypothetical protein